MNGVRLLRKSILGIICLSASQLFAQYGGSYTYAYLNMSPSARMSALSGFNITNYDDDINSAYFNPALLNAEMDGALSFSQAFYGAGITQGYAAFGKYADKWHLAMGGGIAYHAYGTFEFTDVNGDRIGSFSAGEYAAQWGVAYSSGKLQYGAQAKLLYAKLESYSSFGMAMDLGAAFVDTAKDVSIGLTLRNIGSQFKPYTEGNYDDLPFSVDLGISKRLEHLPLRLTFTLHDLQTFDIRYDDPNRQQAVNIFGVDTNSTEKNYTVDKIAQHLNVSGEFYFGKNVNVQIGYDHMTRHELAIDTRRGMSGFSLGFGMHIKQFDVQYGHGFYTLAGGVNQITIASNLSAWRKKGMVPSVPKF
ncbi:MAG: type IX secretion system protein PorQ [Chitinophagales bacterium]